MKELVEEIQTMMEEFMKNANAQVENGNEVDNSRSASYINLPPGDYELQIRSTNSDGKCRLMLRFKQNLDN